MTWAHLLHRLPERVVRLPETLVENQDSLFDLRHEKADIMHELLSHMWAANDVPLSLHGETFAPLLSACLY